MKSETTEEATEGIIGNPNEEMEAETTGEATTGIIDNLTPETAAETTGEATAGILDNLNEEMAAETTEVATVEETAEMKVQILKNNLPITTGSVKNVQTRILVLETSATNVMLLEAVLQGMQEEDGAPNREINAHIKKANKSHSSNIERQEEKVRIMHTIDHQRKLAIEDLKMMIFEGLM